MHESKASRRLVKSRPELWSEVSNAASLQRHLDQFGEIRITKLEPETGVAWEGECARGTITLEPAGWGTRVSLTAQPLRAGGDHVTLERAGEPVEGGEQAESHVEGGEQTGSHVEGPEQALRGDIHDALGAGEAPADELLVRDLPPSPARSPMLAYSSVETEIRQLAAFVERSKREAELRKGRWPRRLARAFRRWLGSQSDEDLELPREEDPPETMPRSPVPADPAAEPGVTEAGPAPSHLDVGREHAACASEPAPVGYELSPTRYEPAGAGYEAGPTGSEPDSVMPDAANASSSVEPDQQPDGAGKLGRLAPPSAALTAALDSLGRAHHRPFSRA